MLRPLRFEGRDVEKSDYQVVTSLWVGAAEHPLPRPLPFGQHTVQRTRGGEEEVDS